MIDKKTIITVAGAAVISIALVTAYKLDRMKEAETEPASIVLASQEVQDSGSFDAQGDTLICRWVTNGHIQRRVPCSLREDRFNDMEFIDFKISYEDKSMTLFNKGFGQLYGILESTGQFHIVDGSCEAGDGELGCSFSQGSDQFEIVAIYE